MADQLFIASYYKQIPANMYCTIMRLKPVFQPEMPKARTNKTGLNLMTVHFYIRRKMDIIRYNTGKYIFLI